MSDPYKQLPITSYNREIYGSQSPPLLKTVNLDEVEEDAKKRLAPYGGAFNYVGGSAGSERTYRSNRDAFHKWKIVPRMLRSEASVRDLSVTLFGTTYPSPILLAPIGVQGMLHRDAEPASARAATKLGIPFIMSTASTRSIEEVASASGNGHRWYQLYWPKSDDITVSLLKRAKASGFTALVVTLDTTILGWRPKDLTVAYLPFRHGVGCGIGLTDPVFTARYPPLDPSILKFGTHPEFPYEPDKWNAIERGEQGEKATAEIKQLVQMSLDWIGETTSGMFKDWKDIAFLMEHWDGPIILKGILSVDDAVKAVQFGVDGIVVSNHGGRQVDGAISTLSALEKIVKNPIVRHAQAVGKFTIFMDSGIRTGSDIIKAIAIGANAVLLGRPYVYGLTLEGEEGVEAVIKTILTDLYITMGLSGLKSIQEIHRSAERETDVVIIKED